LKGKSIVAPYKKCVNEDPWQAKKCYETMTKTPVNVLTMRYLVILFVIEEAI